MKKFLVVTILLTLMGCAESSRFDTDVNCVGKITQHASRTITVHCVTGEIYYITSTRDITSRMIKSEK